MRNKTLRELQRTNPIGTHFQLTGWEEGEYIYFDGVCWLKAVGGKDKHVIDMTDLASCLGFKVVKEK